MNPENPEPGGSVPDFGFTPASANGIGVWRVRVRDEPATIARYRACLTRQERERASRFRRADDRLRFETARGSVRHLLADYLDDAPESVEIEVDALGKPRIVGDNADLSFNSSHSGGWVLHAIARSTQLGVDVERLDSEIGDRIDEVRSVLAPEEIEHLARLPTDARPAEFLRTWVRKEAYLKATGEGFRRLPERVSIASCDSSVHLARDDNLVTMGLEWNIVDLEIDSVHMGALAYSGAPRPISIWDYAGPAA